MTILDWTAYAEASEDHRDVHDPDIVVALHECQKDAELLHLARQQGRLP